MSAESRPSRPIFRLMRQALAFCSWLAVFAALAAWAVVRQGDSWAPATFLMFGPRRLLAAPIVILMLIAVVLRRKSLGPLLLALFFVVWPIMGFNVPWGKLRSSPEGDLHLRVATCNMHYGRPDPDRLENFLSSVQPDVIAFQEWPDSERSKAFNGPEWHVHRDKNFVVASRFPLRNARRLSGKSDEENGAVHYCEVVTPAGAIHLMNLHFASPRDELKQAAQIRGSNLADLEVNSDLRRRQSQFVREEAAKLQGPILLVGDFNTPCESVIFPRYWSGYNDAFSDCGWGWGHTFINRWTRVRIDHILVGGGGQAADCRVGPELGSPHKPLIADVVWPESQVGPVVPKGR